MRRRPLVSLFVLVLVLNSCAQPSIDTPRQQEPVQGSWFSVLTQSDVEIVRQIFPKFQPEVFAPGVNPQATLLTPSNFRPASFFGPAQPQGKVSTPGGVLIETSGLGDIEEPEFLPEWVTYFDRDREMYRFRLQERDLRPLREIQMRMGLAVSSDIPPLIINPRVARINLEEVDNIMAGVKDAVATYFPQVRNLPPSTCEIVVQPTLFYVTNSNFGDTWAGGLTEPIGGGKFRLHVLFFYINSQRVFADWRPFLAHETMNCYVMAIGRADLAI